MDTLYTKEQKLTRDRSRWTLVQGILAPIQFIVFLVSLYFVLQYLVYGTSFGAATASVVCKTAILYLIMLTGALWEKDVFDQYLFAPGFYWEDVVSMGVIALHTAYLLAWFYNILSPQGQMLLALAAYSAYLINAAQFVIKFRIARALDKSMRGTEHKTAHTYRKQPDPAL